MNTHYSHMQNYGSMRNTAMTSPVPSIRAVSKVTPSVGFVGNASMVMMSSTLIAEINMNVATSAIAGHLTGSNSTTSIIKHWKITSSATTFSAWTQSAWKRSLWFLNPRWT